MLFPPNSSLFNIKFPILDSKFLDESCQTPTNGNKALVCCQVKALIIYVQVAYVKTAWSLEHMLARLL